MNENFEKIKAITETIRVKIIKNKEDFGIFKDIDNETELKTQILNFGNHFYTINSYLHFIFFYSDIYSHIKNFEIEVNDFINSRAIKYDKLKYLKDLIFNIENIDRKYYETTNPMSDLPIPKMVNSETFFPDEFKYENTNYIDGEVLSRISEFGYLIKEKLNQTLSFLYHLLGQVNDLPENYYELKDKNKLKTNLSVPEIAYLFSSLLELKPGMFDIKTETELHRFISENFSSKKADEISTNSLKKYFNEPDQNAIDFWKKHFSTLLYNSKKNN